MNALGAILAAAVVQVPAISPVSTCRFPGGRYTHVALHEGLAVAGAGWSREDEAACFDLTDPAHPKFLCRFPARGYVSGDPVFLDGFCYIPSLYCGLILDVRDVREPRLAGLLNPRFPKVGCRSVWIDEGRLRYDTFEGIRTLGEETVSTNRPPAQKRRKGLASAVSGSVAFSLEDAPYPHFAVSSVSGNGARRKVSEIPFADKLASLAVRNGVAYVYAPGGQTHTLLTLRLRDGIGMFEKAIGMPKLSRDQWLETSGVVSASCIECRGTRLFFDDGLAELAEDGSVRLIRERTLPGAAMDFDGDRVAVAQGSCCRTVDFGRWPEVALSDYAPTGAVHITGCVLEGRDLFIAYARKESKRQVWLTRLLHDGYLERVRDGRTVCTLRTEPGVALTKVGRYLYLTGGQGTLHIIDAGDPSCLRSVGVCREIYDGECLRLKWCGERLFCLSGRRVCELDVSNPLKPRVKTLYRRGLGRESPNYDDFCLDGSRLYALAQNSIDEYILDDPSRTEQIELDTGCLGRLAPSAPIEGSTRFDGHRHRTVPPKGVVFQGGEFDNAFGKSLRDWAELPGGNYAVAWGEGGLVVCGPDGRYLGELPRSEGGWVYLFADGVIAEGSVAYVMDGERRVFAIECADPRHPRPKER